MCTVSFISRNNTVYLTSNRDENIARRKAFLPEVQKINDTNILFPKDPHGGGSWFIINENKCVGILLNGAFTKHVSTGVYKRSRGLILLEVMTSFNPYQSLSIMELEDIEPFTLILFQENKLYEYRWDGNKKHMLPLSIESDYIWSSSTLYDLQSKNKRENLFKDFIDNTSIQNGDQIVDFHQSNQEDLENGFVMKRNSGVETLSVTQAALNLGTANLVHHDLKEKTINHTALKMTSNLDL